MRDRFLHTQTVALDENITNLISMKLTESSVTCCYCYRPLPFKSCIWINLKHFRFAMQLNGLKFEMKFISLNRFYFAKFMIWFFHFLSVFLSLSLSAYLFSFHFGGKFTQLNAFGKLTDVFMSFFDSKRLYLIHIRYDYIYTIWIFNF